MQRAVFERLSQLETSHWWFTSRRTILRNVIRNEMARSPDIKILEAGCGTGGNLAMLSSLGQLTAFEPDDEARAVANEKNGCTIAPGTLPDGIPFKSDKFDLIVAFDVIEHVEQDTESLAALRKHLAPGGKLIMTVPALPWLWSAHDERHHHFRRYTRLGLRTVLEDAGYRVVKLTYFNTLLFPLVVAARAVKKMLGIDDSVDDQMPSPPVNALLKSIFSFERYFVGKVPLPIGVSLLAVVEGDAQ